MKVTARKEIFVERERSVTIRLTDNALPPTYCRECQPESRFVTIDEAAMLNNKTSRQIFRLVENNEIHFSETAEGVLLVCFASLTGAANANQSLTGEE